MAAPTPEQRALIAQHVGRRRRTLGLAIDAAAELVGMSPVTWGRVEKSETVRALTYSGIERALGWAEGSIDSIADGGDPTAIGGAPAPTGPNVVDRAVMDDPIVARILASGLPDDRKASLIHMVLRDRRRAETAIAERVDDWLAAEQDRSERSA